jgi:hypothetical protein
MFDEDMLMDEIHCFSGLASSWIPGLRRGTKALEKLIDALPQAEAEHHIWDEWPEVASAIVRRWSKTKEPFKTILIGHSNGVISTNSIAAHLAARGLPCDYIGAIDPTAGSFPLIGMNVGECSEFWASSGWPALTRRFTGNKRAALHFVPGWPGIHRLYHIPGSHIACASSKRVHQTIVADVKRVLA